MADVEAPLRVALTGDGIAQSSPDGQTWTLHRDLSAASGGVLADLSYDDAVRVATRLLARKAVDYRALLDEARGYVRSAEKNGVGEASDLLVRIDAALTNASAGTDYRALLEKYIEHVGANEGTSFLTGPHHDDQYFTEAEWGELQRLDRERG